MTNKAISRREFLATSGVASIAGAVGLPGSAIAESAPRKLKMVTPWPKNSPGLGSSAERLAQLINELSDGRLHIDVFAAGELVEAFEVFDAVSAGVADMYHSAEYYWQDKSPAFSFFGTVPFGFTASEMQTWIHHGGGQALWNELSAQFNLKPLIAGSTGVQMGGWFAKEITAVNSFEGLRIRIPGLGGEVLKRLGAIVVSLPGGEIVPAMQSGAIDASEWVGPWLDYDLGLHNVAAYYYYPGFHEPGPSLTLSINKDVWNDISELDRHVIQTAAAAERALSLADFNAQNAITLQKLVLEHGIKIRSLPDEVLSELGKATNEVLIDISANDPLTKRIYDSFINYRRSVMRWSDVSERAYLNARRVAYPAAG